MRKYELYKAQSVTYVLPGPQAVGQVLGVQNSDSALENRFMCLKNATAERNQTEEIYVCILKSVFCIVCEDKEQETRSTNSQKKSAVLKGCLLTVAGEPLCLVDTRRQRREGKHVCVCDLLAHILLLQIWTLLQIIVINSPWGAKREQS